MTNIVLLLVIIMLVFSVIGITLFREVMPNQFGDLSTGKYEYFKFFIIWKLHCGIFGDRYSLTCEELNLINLAIWQVVIMTFFISVNEKLILSADRQEPGAMETCKPWKILKFSENFFVHLFFELTKNSYSGLSLSRTLKGPKELLLT